MSPRSLTGPKSAEAYQDTADLLNEDLDLAVLAAIDVHTHQYQFPSEQKRSLWTENELLPRTKLALDLVVLTFRRDLISDMIGIWRLSGVVAFLVNRKSHATQNLERTFLSKRLL